MYCVQNKPYSTTWTLTGTFYQDYQNIKWNLKEEDFQLAFFQYKVDWPNYWQIYMQSTSVLCECKFQLIYQQHYELENDILGKTEIAVEVAT